MREIFGYRFICISRHASRRNPKRRYRSVAALRKAWLRIRRLPVYLAVLLAFACLYHPACELVSWKRQVDRAQREATERANLTESFKERVDAYYATEIAAAKERLSQASTYAEAVAIWTGLIDRYNRFWKELVAECPEDCSVELVNHIQVKYGAEFPLPPQE